MLLVPFRKLINLLYSCLEGRKSTYQRSDLATNINNHFGNCCEWLICSFKSRNFFFNIKQSIKSLASPVNPREEVGELGLSFDFEITCFSSSNLNASCLFVYSPSKVKMYSFFTTFLRLDGFLGPHLTFFAWRWSSSIVQKRDQVLKTISSPTF